MSTTTPAQARTPTNARARGEYTRSALREIIICNVQLPKIMMFYRTIYLLLALLACPAAGLNTNLSRRSALLGACTAVVGVRPAPVAATAPPSVKSNAEKKYDDECISKCASKLQNINRGVGKVEYVSRIEAIKECKPGCKKQ